MSRKGNKRPSIVSRPAEHSPKTAASPSVPAETTTDLSYGAWILGSILVLLGGTLVRFIQLGVSAFDHDEGVNALLTLKLFREGFYAYDPAKFHGPTLYYFSLVVAGFNSLLGHPEGVTETAMRCGIALVGIAILWLILQLRPWLGAWGSLGSAALIAVSPAAVYFSRFYIHEMLFVFFTLGIVTGILYYEQTSRPICLWLAAVSAALLFATKETAFITVGVLGLAYACTVGYLAWQSRGRREGKSRRKARAAQPENRNFRWPLRDLIGAAVVFVVIYLAFYSSFGRNLPGIVDSFRTFRFWAKSGVSEQLSDSPWLYCTALVKEEPSISVLGILGLVLALARSRSRFPVFCGFWALGILAAYSLIPYKTPWLALNTIIPLALVAGYAVAEGISLMKSGMAWQRVAVPVLLTAALAVSAREAIDISYVRWDDSKVFYCNRRTMRDIVDLTNTIIDISHHNGRGKASIITCTSDQMIFPLSWSLRDYYNVHFWEQLTPDQTDILMVRALQAPATFHMLADRFAPVGSYLLRPGVRVVVLARIRR